MPLTKTSEVRYISGMDWKKLISELGSQGLSQPQIAAICGCGQATISDLSNGKTKDPRDSLGQALRALMDKTKAENAAKEGPAHA